MQITSEFGQPVGRPVSWEPPPPLEALTAQGRTVALAPLTPDHAEGMWAALGPDPAQWTYMPANPPQDTVAMRDIITGYCDNPGYLPHVITDPDGTVLGMASYLRVQPALGTAEIGAISYGTHLRRSTAATEAMTLLAGHVFASGYRRYEWKCDSLNVASRAAALRLGFRFEGVWRNALVYKGRNRDHAWFAMTDDDWRRLEPVHRDWLQHAGDTQPYSLSHAVAALWADDDPPQA